MTSKWPEFFVGHVFVGRILEMFARTTVNRLEDNRHVLEIGLDTAETPAGADHESKRQFRKLLLMLRLLVGSL
tara:strand:+ start:208 stop:426 length:219 start_codon:yes stop_codon:yes gene_type:complete